MRLFARIFAWSITGAGVIALGLGARRAASDTRVRQIERALIGRSTHGLSVGSPELADLPEPARRYLEHTIGPDGKANGAVRLQMTGRMAPNEDAGLVDLTAEELLALPHGFIWTAQFNMRGLPVRVRDHYFDEHGSVSVELLNIIPLPTGSGPDVARSSRHRLAAESIWCPSALIPQDGVAWEGVDSTHARATLVIGSEDIPLTFTIDEEGRLQEVTMHRWGNVGVEEWQLIPYGFAVTAEAEFGGITIPTRVVGGWWYGTDRFNLESAAEFVILDARLANGAINDYNSVFVGQRAADSVLFASHPTQAVQH